MDLTLGDVETTALIPLVIKANESLRPNARIYDGKAVEIIRFLQIDTKKYDNFMSHEGVIARTIMLDRKLKAIIAEQPDAVIVNIGAGFDDRFSRVDNGKIRWFDVDFPDSIKARRKVFPERDRVKMIEGDALESHWCDEVKKVVGNEDVKPIVIAEGLFMYLTMDQIRTLLNVLKNNFRAGGTLIAEQNCKMMQGKEKYHDTVKTTKAHFMSGTDSAQEIADLTDGFTLIEERSFNEEMKKYTLGGKIFALLLPKLNDRWALFIW